MHCRLEIHTTSWSFNQNELIVYGLFDHPDVIAYLELAPTTAQSFLHSVCHVVFPLQATVFRPLQRQRPLQLHHRLPRTQCNQHRQHCHPQVFVHTLIENSVFAVCTCCGHVFHHPIGQGVPHIALIGVSMYSLTGTTPTASVVVNGTSPGPSSGATSQCCVMWGFRHVFL